jgi:3-methyladenine DNA glycosylase AlkD
MSERGRRLIGQIRAAGSPEAVKGMARFGISSARTCGVSMPALTAMAKGIGRDHDLAEELWASGVHEARIMAAMIEDPTRVAREQMEAWVQDIDSWDVGDQFCLKLVVRTSFAHELAKEWCHRPEEFVRRAGFALVASLAVHDRKATDSDFMPMLGWIEAAADDDRPMVRKAVNWALRQIGKRNAGLHAEAVTCARRLLSRSGKAARWIASDALRELESDAVKARLANRTSR